MPKTQKTFAERLRSLREAAGLSIADLSRRAGLTYQAVSFLETGERQPSLETARKLAVALDRTLECWQ